MNRLNPLISVIIPVFNAEAFIGRAIESILQQNYSPLEIIVVDDGSTDGSAYVVKGFEKKIRYSYQKNRGAPTARNRGLELSQGEIITFLDADDLWPENKLDIQLSRLKQEQSMEIVLGRKEIYKLAGQKDGEFLFYQDGDPQTVLNLGAALFKRTVFEKVGLFDTSLLHTDDWDWFIRAKDMGVSIGMFPEVTLMQRLHGSNITRDQESGKRYMLQMLKKNIDRRHRQQQSIIKSFHVGGISGQTKNGK